VREYVKDRVLVGLAVALAVLVILEATVFGHEHPRFPWHHVPGYAGLIGLIASLLIVQLSKTVGKKLLQRRETDDY
jgi:uncharacterized membrane protein